MRQTGSKLLALAALGIALAPTIARGVEKMSPQVRCEGGTAVTSSEYTTVYLSPDHKEASIFPDSETAPGVEGYMLDVDTTRSEVSIPNPLDLSRSFDLAIFRQTPGNFIESPQRGVWSPSINVPGSESVSLGISGPNGSYQSLAESKRTLPAVSKDVCVDGSFAHAPYRDNPGLATRARR